MVTTTTTSNIRTAPWMQETLREGFALLSAGRLEEASACCKRLLGAKPDLVEGHFLVGLIALEMKSDLDRNQRVRLGHEASRKITVPPGRISPNCTWRRGNPESSGYERSSRPSNYNDGNPIVLDLIGTVYGLLGDQRSASVWIKKAVEKKPKSIPFLINLANNHTCSWASSTRRRKYSAEVLGMHPGNPNAHWILSNVRKVTDRRHIEQLQKLLRQENRNPRAIWRFSTTGSARNSRISKSGISRSRRSRVARRRADDARLRRAGRDRDVRGLR